MNILIEAFVFILVSYISLTNSLAGYIEAVLPNETATQEVSEQTDDEFVLLPSLFGETLPNILLESSEYQAATVGAAAGLTGATVTDPQLAIVNIFCTFTTKEYIRTTTGTGFFIDPDGVIMTNAHIAQFLLLEKTDSFGDAECVIRDGSPARARYNADLLYIPPAWIQENSSMINDSVPMGTGERDYALLYVTEDITGTPLPASFPALPFDDDLLPTSVRGATVVAAGYPAKDLLLQGSESDLPSRIATTNISELYTFGSNFADVFSIKGSVVGAEGASGGPVVNEAGAVIGMIATRGDDEIDGSGSLRAITLSHINRTMEEETGFGLQENLNGNLPYRSQVFAETMTPFLLSLLEAAR
jgi:S1-C subfamily serine protease